MEENTKVQKHLIILGNGNRVSFDSHKESNEKLRPLFEEYIASSSPLTFGKFISWLEKSKSSIRPYMEGMKQVGSSNINEPIGKQTVVLDGYLEMQRYDEGIR